MLPDASINWTAPLRNPAAVGPNETATVQVFPAVWPPVQDVLPSVKSRFGAPWVTTDTEPNVTLMLILKTSVCVRLQGTGVVCPVGQMLTFPKLTPPAGTSTTQLLPVSAMKTVPAASAAALVG